MARFDDKPYAINLVESLVQSLLKLQENIRRCEENLEQATRILSDLREIYLQGKNSFNQLYLSFSDTHAFPNKELIISFVRRYYNKKIPTDWTRSSIEREAARVVSERGNLARFNEYLSRFLREKENIQKINVFTMTPEDIKKEFSNEEKYPNVEFIKLALEKGFRKKLKGVTSRESAIKKIIDEVGKLRSVGRILKE
jgi:hypothetical protein